VDSRKDPLASYRARIDAMKAQLERDRAEADAVRPNPAPTAGKREGGRLLSLAVLAGVALLSLGLVGAGITLTNLAGHDFDKARVAGWATVRDCEQRGPVTNRGFGYWDSCRVLIRWDDGRTDSVLSNGMFSPADTGRDVRVGYLGESNSDLDLAREGTPARPWLRWIGVSVGLVGGLPLMFVAFLASLATRRE
jgi:hypothetical protein